MKILLINPFLSYKKKISPLLGLAYIASSLEKEGHTVKIIDCSASKYPQNDTKKEIRHFDPDVVGVYSMTQSIFDALDVIRIAKKCNPDCLTVLGGPHPTVRARETLTMSEFIDVVVRGEGEHTIADLLKKFEEKGTNGFSDVKGITFRKDKRIVENKDRPLIKDLDSLPFPAYHLLPMKKYKFQDGLFGIFHVEKRNIPFCHIITSRGCPYDCSFCSSRALWGKELRNRNPNNIIEEIKILNDKYNMKVICFEDDTFTVDKKRVVKICNLIEKEKFDISFICKTRADLFDKEIAINLKNAGFSHVYFGLESGVQKILEYLCKGFTIQDSEKAVNIAKEADLKVGANFVIGIPGETKEDIKKTISFARKLNLDRTTFSILTPFPGTKIYEYAKKYNLLFTRNWEKYKFDSSLMKVPGLSQRELNGFLIKAYLLCNLSPLRFLRYLLKDFPTRGFE